MFCLPIAKQKCRLLITQILFKNMYCVLVYLLFEPVFPTVFPSTENIFKTVVNLPCKYIILKILVRLLKYTRKVCRKFI